VVVVVFNGPHGETFSWSREHGHRDLDLLREFIHAREASSPGFLASARAVALKAITLPDTVMIRTAIQVLCVVGTDDDLKLVAPLMEDSREGIRVDARCCLFERGVKRPADAG
jgi:hypothetical protein